MIAELREEQLQPADGPGNQTVLEGDGSLAHTSIPGGTLVVAPDIAKEIGQLSAGFEYSRMEARVAKLEESVAAMMRLMSHLVRASDKRVRDEVTNSEHG